MSSPTPRRATPAPRPHRASARAHRRVLAGILACATLSAACAPSPDRTGATATDSVPVASSLSPEELAVRRGTPVEPGAVVDVLAFGSCNRETLPQEAWDDIAATDPDVWVWLGDNIYGDTEDMDVLRAKYEEVLSDPGYRALLGEARIVGTWDDHDYGANNAGSDYPMREASQKELLDFLGEPAESPRRERAGVYTSYTWGPPERRVKLVLLDARYHRDEPTEDGSGDILGEAQWAWLEDELAGSDARLNLVGGGIQFLPVDHRFEKWAEFPEARERLLRTLAASGAPGIVLLSGDRHIAEIHRMDDAGLGYPLWEVTSSGLTHSWENVGEEPNRYRVGELYPERNFGTVAVDWDAGTAALRIRSVETGEVVREVVLRLDELRPAG